MNSPHHYQHPPPHRHHPRARPPRLRRRLRVRVPHHRRLPLAAPSFASWAWVLCRDKILVRWLWGGLRYNDESGGRAGKPYQVPPSPSFHQPCLVRLLRLRLLLLRLLLPRIPPLPRLLPRCLRILLPYANMRVSFVARSCCARCVGRPVLELMGNKSCSGRVA